MMLEAETLNLLTGLSQRIAAKGERILRKSQTLAVRSSEPETTLSSRVNVTQVTALKEIRGYQCYKGEFMERGN